MARPKPPASTLVAAVTVFAILVSGGTATAQGGLPKRDVVDVPAIGEGLCLHNLFQSNMVLQRDRPVRIWGWAAPGDEVSVALGDARRVTTAAADRVWSVSFEARPARSSPVELLVSCGDEELRLDNILFGDVWLLGGQSNMEFPLERVDNGWLEIVSARFEQLRILTVPAPQGFEVRRGFPRLHEWSDWFKRHFRKGDWDVCSPEVAVDLSAIGYVFARRIHMATEVPIGVIDVSRGGTALETWLPERVLRSVDVPEVKAWLAEWDRRVASWDAEADLARRVRSFEARVATRRERGEAIPADWKVPTDLRAGPAADMNRPGSCFNSMLTPLAGLAVKGAIFHQGYNNAMHGGSGAKVYAALFGPMIRAWRETFGDPQMPFGIISLCTDGPRQTRENYAERMLDEGVLIREAQYRTFLDLRAAGDANVGFASSFDKRRSWYHPQLKIPVGERISRWALATQYGLADKIRWTPPMCTRVDVEEGTIVLHMDRAVSAADTKAPIEGFAVAGEDRAFHPAVAEWQAVGADAKGRPRRDRRVLVLSSPQVPRPVHFRYGWGRNPMGNLQSADHSDLPFATQRSDDWPVGDVPLGVLGDDAVEGGRLSRPQRQRILRALRRQDLQRRLAEARALLEEHGQLPRRAEKK